MKKRLIWIGGIFLLLCIGIYVGSALLSKPGTVTLSVPGQAKIQPDNWQKTATIYLGANQFYLLDRLSPQSEGAPKALWAIPNDSLAGTLQQIKQKTDVALGPDSLVFVLKPLPSSTYENIVNAMDRLTEAKVRRYAIDDALTEPDKALLETIQAL